MGGTDLLKPQNPGEVVVLAKSATLAHQVPPCARSMNDTTACEDVTVNDPQKQLGRTSFK